MGWSSPSVAAKSKHHISRIFIRERHDLVCICLASPLYKYPNCLGPSSRCRSGTVTARPNSPRNFCIGSQYYWHGVGVKAYASVKSPEASYARHRPSCFIAIIRAAGASWYRRVLRAGAARHNAAAASAVPAISLAIDDSIFWRTGELHEKRTVLRQEHAEPALCRSRNDANQILTIYGSFCGISAAKTANEISSNIS